MRRRSSPSSPKTQTFTKKNRRESEKRIFKLIDEKFASLNQELRSEVSTKESTYTALGEKLEKSLTELSQKIRIMSAEHEENIMKFSNSFNKEANQVLGLIDHEKNLIESSHLKVEDLINDVVVRTKVR